MPDLSDDLPPDPTDDPAEDGPARRQRLRADCSACVALCCIVPAFSRSAHFAIDKPVGVPCPNLADDHRCGIHDDLVPRGFAGCTYFDCFGAGQHLTQVTFGGRLTRATVPGDPVVEASLTVARGLHELLWYLGEVTGDGGPVRAGSAASASPALRAEAGALVTEIDEALALPGEELGRVDLEALRKRAGDLLHVVSAEVRAAAPRAARLPRRIGRRRDLAGARLAGADLRGADLRGCLLVGADLAGADLRSVDLLGADLRGADVRGARLEGALFLAQGQVNAARGDAATRLPADLERPSGW